MKIKVTRNTVVNGSVYPVGSIVETSDQAGKYLVKIGKAEEIKPKGKAEKATAKPAEEKAVDPKTED